LKIRESGMPDEKTWAEFFDIDLILSELQINSSIIDLVEIGCGYGTFTIPAAQAITGNLYAYDIEKEMIDIIKQKAARKHLNNIIPFRRDILSRTTGLPDNSADYTMLFNILHHDSPLDLLNEANRILKPNGKLGIIHWRSDIPTPRGPDLSIRPKPEQILEWIANLNFKIHKDPFVIKPYHFGLILTKNDF
jgi:SAM-dependent methyltransferase